jgi:predicted dehydrogenase
MNQTRRVRRRSFLKQAALGIAAVPLFARNLISAPPSRIVRHASFGAAGMAGNDLQNLANQPALQLVCAAEVDLSRWDGLKKRFPDGKVKIYQDWRQMLDKEAKHLDSVNIGTPDHMHAPMAMSAMQLGLHAYVQKPLAHDLYEVRRLTEAAREKKLVTQMGIQCHSMAYYRIGVKVIQSGAIGKVQEVHLWSSKKWGDSQPRPERSDPVPSTLNWDSWLGVAAQRPYLGGGYYHPGNWRKRLDFGTGTFGDMGCHIYDPVYESLALGAPLSVRSEGPPPSRWNWAIDAVIHYVFPGTQYTEGKTIPVTWYDGDRRPSKDVQALLGDKQLPDQGSIFLGTKGVMLLEHCGRPALFPLAQFKDFKLPHDSGSSHWKQFTDAVLGEGATSAPLSYSGPLTEAVLLGGVSTHFPRITLDWDAVRLQFTNHAEANQLIRRTYRKGWEVKGLS